MQVVADAVEQFRFASRMTVIIQENVSVADAVVGDELRIRQLVANGARRDVRVLLLVLRSMWQPLNAFKCWEQWTGQLARCWLIS